MGKVEVEVQGLLSQRGETLATAESLTAGELAALVSGPTGASLVYLGGVITYATALKRDLLGVRAEQVVSAECAAQMAEGVRDLVKADWGLSTTGVAGPDLQEEQPVGLVYVGVASAAYTSVVRLELDIPTGEEQRALIRSAACQAAIAALAERLSAEQP
ncbi:MAG: nicotinamide-nucleotide amidohydrolase family protein [Nocardioidaceae bacterium]|nr:nicotinamide-nucleotide amidohydrolase family protein [Nocardioidaceae bacterium]